MERHLPQRVVTGLQLAIDQVERQLQAPGNGRAGDLRRCGIGVHAQALAAGIHLELGMQQLQLGQAGRLVPIMARIAEARGEIHVAQQLHAVIAGVCLAERDFGIEQFGWAATQLLQEPHGTLALADDQQLAEACAADAVAVDGVERKVQPWSLRGGEGMASSTRLISAELRWPAALAPAPRAGTGAAPPIGRWRGLHATRRRCGSRGRACARSRRSRGRATA